MAVHSGGMGCVQGQQFHGRFHFHSWRVERQQHHYLLAIRQHSPCGDGLHFTRAGDPGHETLQYNAVSLQLGAEYRLPALVGGGELGIADGG